MQTILKNKWLSILIVLVMVANIATLSMYWYTKLAGKPFAGKAEKGAAAAFLIKELQFSKDQESKYKQLIDQHQQSARQLNDALRLAKEAYFNLLESNTVDSTQQADALNKLMQTQQQLEQLTFNHFVQVKAICTPVQKNTFNTVIKKAMRMMGPKPQGPPPGGGRGDGPPPPPHEHDGPPH